MASDELTPMGTVPSSGALIRRALSLLVVAVALILLFTVVPGLGEVRERFSRADPLWLVVTCACALASAVSYVAAVRGTLSKRIGWRASWNLGMAEQGSNVLLPTGGVGGPALGALVLSRAGVPTSFAAPRSAALFMLTSATSFVAIAASGTATGVGLLPGASSWLGTLLPAGLAVVVVSAVIAAGHLPVGQPDAGQRRIGRWGRHLAGLVRDGSRESLELLRNHSPLVIGGCVGYLAFDIAALGAGFEAFGESGPPIGIFVLAYTLGQAGALIPTPGGLGGTEGGLIGTFVLYGASVAPATAAVLAYRVFQLGVPAVLGVIAFTRIQRRLRDETLVASVAARFSDDPPA